MIKHFFNETIIRSYDIRGVYKKTLYDLDAKIVGNLFGLKAGEGSKVCVGYDGRKSSVTLKENLIFGLQEVGVDVIEVGLCPTPLVYFSCYQTNAKGGIMVTGSHNPADHNGFKFVLDNNPFYGEDIRKLSEKAKKYSFKKNLLGKREFRDISSDYINRIMKDFQQKRKINIVWDSGNGSAGIIMKKLSEKMGGKSILMFDDVDGNFPNHHPDPSEEKNLQDCIKILKKNKFDIGIAFDGDGDRIGIVDDKGRIIPGDQILLIFATDILTEGKKTIIGDVKCSQVLFDEIERLGGKAIMSKTGHSHIKVNIKKFSADLAGEMSGHMFFSDKYFGFDDALYASVRIINILANGEKKLSDMVDAIPKTFCTPELRIDCEDLRKFDIIESVTNNLKKSNCKIIDVDGVRVIFDDGWWLLRASNTQPALVLRCESLTSHGLEKKIEHVKRELNKVDSNLLEKIIT